MQFKMKKSKPNKEITIDMVYRTPLRDILQRIKEEKMDPDKVVVSYDINWNSNDCVDSVDLILEEEQ